MIKTLNDVICFGFASLACSITALGLLGVDPTVSSDTNRVCTYSPAVSTSCKAR